MLPLTVSQRRFVKKLLNDAKNAGAAFSRIERAHERAASVGRAPTVNQQLEWSKLRRKFLDARQRANNYIREHGFDPLTFNFKSAPTMLEHKRFIIRAKNRVNKKYKAVRNAVKAYFNTNQQRSPGTEARLMANWTRTQQNLINAQREFNSIAAKIYPGVNPRNLPIEPIQKGLLTNLLTKVGANKLKHAAWRVGLEGQRKKAQANFNEFSQTGRLGPRQVNHIGESHRKKTPSPPRARAQSRSPPRVFNANQAFARVHALAPATNAPVTWSRNQNAKVTRHKTFTQIARGVTPIQRLALAAMTPNEKQKFVKSLARL